MKTVVSYCLILISSLIIFSCSKSGQNVDVVKLIPVKTGELYQYIDLEGKIVINPQFSEATIFRDGLALVKGSGDNPKWGYISNDGKYQINPNYKSATVFSEEIAWVVSENSAPTAINLKGEVIGTIQNAEEVANFHEKLAAFSVLDSSGTKWGFLDKNITIKINPQFARTDKFSDGLCAVQNKEGKWGYVNSDGLLAINYQFDSAGPFTSGTAIVKSAEKYGVIDKDGKYIVNPQFSDMIHDGDSYVIEQNGQWGWCDKEGKFEINPQFSSAYPFGSNSIAAVKSGEQYGFIDKEGKISVNPQFEYALPFNGEISAVLSSSKIGFINKEGKFLINPQFDGLSADYATYIFNGSSMHDIVETDFFNMDIVGSSIETESPEGFSFNSTFGEIKNQLKLDETTFSKYNNETQVINSKSISNDISYSFYVLGSAFNKEQVLRGDGWYSYYDTEYVFNEGGKPTGFAYLFSLSGKGRGKGEAIFTSLINRFVGYTKDASKSSEKDVFLQGNNKVIRVILRTDEIVVIISSETL